MAYALPHPCHEELPKVAIHGRPGRESRRRWQVTPLAPGPHDIEQTVQQPPHVGRSRSTARLWRRDQRFEQTVLIIAQGLTAAEVSNQRAVLGRPHRSLRKEGISLSKQRLSPSFTLTRKRGAALSKRGVSVVPSPALCPISRRIARLCSRYFS